MVPIRLDGYGRVSTEKSEGFIVTHEPLEELNEQTKITPVGYQEVLKNKRSTVSKVQLELD